MEIDTSRWPSIGETSNTRYYQIEPRIIAAVPRVGSRDDESSARENIRFQLAHFREEGQGGVTVVYVDRLVSQDKEARRVYQAEADNDSLRATVLLGGSLLGRAIASFFLGLTKPPIPIKLCADLDEAVTWSREILKKTDAERSTGGGR